MNQIKWTTISQYVDLETGEVLTKDNVISNYDIINKHKLTKFHNETKCGVCYITNECRLKTAKQSKLF